MQRWILDRTGLTVALDESGHRPRLDDKGKDGSADRDHGHRQQEGGQHQWPGGERGRNGGHHLARLERNDRGRLPANRQGHEKYPANQRCCQKQLEQGIGSRLYEGHRPVRCRDQRTPLDGGFENGLRHGGWSHFRSYNQIVQLPDRSAPTLPPPWGRLFRILVLGIAATLVVYVVGRAAEIAVLGSDESAARERVQANVRTSFDAMARALRVIALGLADPASLGAAGNGELLASRRLFAAADTALA